MLSGGGGEGGWVATEKDGLPGESKERAWSKDWAISEGGDGRGRWTDEVEEARERELEAGLLLRSMSEPAEEAEALEKAGECSPGAKDVKESWGPRAKDDGAGMASTSATMSPS